MSTVPEHKKPYVTISYSFSNGKEVLGSSDASGPYSFCMGAGDCIPGLEQHIAEMKEGERKSFVIPAREGYGEYNPDLTKTIPKSVLPESIALREGLQLTINNTPVTVVTIDTDTITVDGNHPLSGIDLHFSVQIESMSDTPPPNYESVCGCGGGGCGCGG